MYKCIVDWDADKNADLPQIVHVQASAVDWERGDDEGDCLVEYLTDTYGFCVLGISYEEVKQ